MKIDMDIAIIGGGLNGTALALALGSTGLSVTLFDAAPQTTRSDDAFDGRATAIAAGSRNMLRALGVWERLGEDAQPIHDILVTDGRVSEGAGTSFLHFDHTEVGDEPFGHLVENRHIRRALFEAISEQSTVEHRHPVRVRSLDRSAAMATLALEDGSTATARLAIACDGRSSPTAQAAGIRYAGWDYPQKGLVCTVEHAEPHGGVAHEYFLPSGPFAILPLTGNRSSLVWTEKTAVAEAAMGLDDAGFEGEVVRRFGQFLGDVKVTGPRWSYPLSLSLAYEYCAPRLALVGDAAHGVHPIAGQGLNLGFKDAAALTQVLVEAARRGEDIGALDVLKRYERWRRFDNAAMGLGMDAINRLFSNDLTPVRALRGMGLDIVNRIGPARRFFMRQAAGLSGEMPRLLQGKSA
jgi:2-octaprenyl-6-methoxyphenol hydroxylase